MSQWAKVPTDLLAVVDGSALQVYVALCRYARSGGHCWPSNAELAGATRLSVPTVTRALRQLVDVGAVERKGRRRRVLRVVPVDSLSITSDQNVPTQSDHPRSAFRSSVINGSRPNEVDPHPRSARVCSPDESESAMQALPEEPMFEVERVERETPIGAACLTAFFDAYGTTPIATSMRRRLGGEFKRLAETYSRDELLAIAATMGERKIASPSAIEGWLLRARQPQQQQRDGWSRLAADTFAQLPDPFAAHG